LALKYGVTKGDENHLKVKFEETIVTTKTKQEIIRAIKERAQNQYIGKVVFDKEVIIKQKWKGIIIMSKSEILKIEDDSGLIKYSLKTQPYFSWTKIDHYTNLSCYRTLESIISGIQQQIIIA